MSNQTVDDCEGFLYDTDALPNDNYNNGEDLTFRICIPGGNSTIEMTFSNFCTELGYDHLKIYDGPDSLSPQIGPDYTGDIFNSPSTVPSLVTATSGCMTLHFISDAAGVTCSGWQASWEVEIDDPDDPFFLPLPNPTCNTTQLTLQLNESVFCDSISASHFTLSGPNAPAILQAQPLSCSGGKTSTVSLTLSAPGLNTSGHYQVTYTFLYIDVCGEEWILTAEGGFTVNDCPINAFIEATFDTICKGDCTELTGGGIGGDPTTYTFQWSGGLPANEGPHTVCPQNTTVYTVTVDDAGPALGDNATKTIVVLPPATVTAPYTVCQSAGWQYLTGNPAGGYWTGPGMVDTMAGIFEPYWAGDGVKTYTYHDPRGCTKTTDVTIIPIWAGLDEAACPGTAPFTLGAYYYPTGGTWSGQGGVQPNGLFNPVTPGSYSVTYTAPNGCTSNKTVRVDNLVVQADDTVCTSQYEYYLTASPFGGIWSGTGIHDGYWGVFRPGQANQGNNVLTYTLQGCSTTINLFVKTINAGPDIVACPAQAPFQLTGFSPPGGTWSGNGIASPTGIFDPGVTNGSNGNITVTYSFDGCTDNKIIYVRRTKIDSDTFYFCNYGEEIVLDNLTTGRSPNGGSWSGPGITVSSQNGVFDPLISGPGVHTIYYTANTCADSMIMYVVPQPVIQDPGPLCETSSPVQLIADQPDGFWVGDFISPDGIFNVGDAGLGLHPVGYAFTPLYCSDTFWVEVVPNATIILEGLPENYCFNDTLFPVNALPAGGILSGNGIQGNNFSPVSAGPGLHIITYTYGSGDCEVSDQTTIIISPPFSITASFTDTTLCSGNFANIRVTGEGGSTATPDYLWNNNLPEGQLQTLQPLQSTTYLARITDYCSIEDTVSIEVTVAPDISLSFTTSPLKCYGEAGFAIASVSPSDLYSYNWNSDSAPDNDTLFASAGVGYSITVTSTTSGCSTQDVVDIPGYDRLAAEFGVSPEADGCITLKTPEVTILDRSIGATAGTWDFGDGTKQAYNFGINPVHLYPDTGTYTISLRIENEGECVDTSFFTFCMELPPIEIPTAITPNGDGVNDRWVIPFIEEYPENAVKIINRWGHLLLESKYYENDWEGMFDGKRLPDGTYYYFIKLFPEAEMLTGSITIIDGR